MLRYDQADTCVRYFDKQNNTVIGKHCKLQVFQCPKNHWKWKALIIDVSHCLQTFWNMDYILARSVEPSCSVYFVALKMQSQWIYCLFFTGLSQVIACSQLYLDEMNITVSGSIWLYITSTWRTLRRLEMVITHQ